MVMSFWWLSCLLLVAGLIAWALAYLNRRVVRHRALFVGNTSYLDQLPSVRRAQRASRVLRLVSVALAGTLVLTGALLSGRLASERVETPSFKNRDIVLCLDVSGSMLPYDREILESYLKLVEGFKGERVGLSVFNSTSRTVFPLTNDYGLIRRELKRGIDALKYNPVAHRMGTAQYSEEDIEKFWDFMGGTYDETLPPSLIGNGLASCGQLFDHAEEERSRFVVVATDNEPGGTGIYETPAAVDTLINRDITMWTFYPGATSCTGNCAQELQSETERSGGKFWASGDPGAIPSIIAEIQKAQAADMGAIPRVIRTDHPALFFTISLIGLLAMIVVGWRQR
ncbi:VWA domain-containing protein [Dermabacter vaginalis]|uniref:VWA domain-containing protein n=2 Tax=Dermabacter vaginalis TaxID=1630135 RepID=A0ABX6A4M9_9MICO|nr:VWA domain-containing protein [Dermabacter vaginalis]